MGYLNNKMGYRDDLMTTRSVVRHGNYAVLTEEGLVKNVVPGFEKTDVTILGSPRIGARFVDYRLIVHPGGGHFEGFGSDGIQTFIYVIEGELEVTVDGKKHLLKNGGYAYTPAGMKLYFENKSEKETKAFLYKKRYDSVGGKYKTYAYVSNISEVTPEPYEGMEDVLYYSFLPTGIEWDMNIHILDFKPGASHGYIETHVQEHGALLLSGKGMYNLDNEWMPVEKGDYIFMGAYALQGTYAIGREEHLSYIYSKDCNRDIEL